MTMLETMLAMSLLTMIALLGAQGLRTTRQAWDLQDNRSTRYQYLEGTLAHITRHLRSARDIVAISAATDASGALTIVLPDASAVTWDHDATSHQVRYGATSPGDLLANDIDTLKFEGFGIDGITPTTVPADIRMIRTTASFVVPVQNVPFSLSTDVWIRKQRDGLAAPFIDFDAGAAVGAGGWANDVAVYGVPDDLFGSGHAGESVIAKNYDTSAQIQTDTVGTVLVGIRLKTSMLMADNFLDVQLRVAGTDGPTHSFGQASLYRFLNSPGWFWIEATGDYSGWTFADVSQTEVTITHRGVSGAGTPTLYVDSVKIRTFTPQPAEATFWITGTGPGQQEWGNVPAAIGASDGRYAHSQNFSIVRGDVDRQSYAYTSSWQDLGTIVRVRLKIGYYLTAPVIDDQFHARLPLLSGPSETTDSPAPVTATRIPTTLLNGHVGIGNSGTIKLDLTNTEDWTWPRVRSRFVRLYMSSIGSPEADIYVDSVRVKVSYVPPNQAAVVLWEEL